MIISISETNSNVLTKSGLFLAFLTRAQRKRLLEPASRQRGLSTQVSLFSSNKSDDSVVIQLAEVGRDLGNQLATTARAGPTKDKITSQIKSDIRMVKISACEK